MGMLIRRHRDRHETESAESADQLTEGKSRRELVAEAKALGLSTQGNKLELAERIAAHQSDESKAPDPEADKVPPTEDDPGAGGDNPDAPAPDQGAGVDPEDAPPSE